MENILELRNVSKILGNQQLLSNINMTIKKGDIYGLIGRSSSGKTTILKCIVQLITPSSGTIHLFGSKTNSDNFRQLKRTGSVIDTPVGYGNLTAYETLCYYAKIRGIIDKDVATEALKFVGLEYIGKKKYKHFSLGMKQKLSLAIALLCKPDFLILDEPINGLDSISIIEFRNLLLKLNKEFDITILISSHILEELYLVANRFGIIKEGRLIKELSKDDFENQSREFISLQVTDTNATSKVLESLKITNFKVLDKERINIYELKYRTIDINRALVSCNIDVISISKEGKSLELYFKELLENN